MWAFKDIASDSINAATGQREIRASFDNGEHECSRFFKFDPGLSAEDFATQLQAQIDLALSVLNEEG